MIVLFLILATILLQVACAVNQKRYRLSFYAAIVSQGLITVLYVFEMIHLQNEVRLTRGEDVYKQVTFWHYCYKLKNLISLWFVQLLLIAFFTRRPLDLFELKSKQSN